MNLISHCIIGNAERVVIYKIAFPTAKKGVLDCQKHVLAIGNVQFPFYIVIWAIKNACLGNLELFLLIKLEASVAQWLSHLPCKPGCLVNQGSQVRSRASPVLRIETINRGPLSI